MQEDSHMVFDCGALGLGDRKHGHDDALSITLFSRGKEILVDPGTSPYNSTKEWRDYFRSTRAHNTVSVEGNEQLGTAGIFGSKGPAEPRVLNHFTLPGIDYVDGEHDGLMSLKQQLTHRRRVLFIRPRYWLVVDQLCGQGEHDYDFLYHFPPDASLFVFGDESRGEVECRANVDGPALQISMFASGPVRTEAICGQTDPIQGWTSDGDGLRKPAPVLKVMMRSFAPATMMSFLATGEPGVARRLRCSAGNAIAAMVQDDKFADLSVLSVEDSTVRLLDYTMRGEFFWLRSENGVLKQLLAVNALSFSNSGESLFESASPISYLLVHFWEDGLVIQQGGQEGRVLVRDLRDRQFQRN
jgi:hypothetical protein